MDWDFEEESADSLSFILGVLGFTFLLTGLILFSPGSFGRLLLAGCPITSEIKKAMLLIRKRLYSLSEKKISSLLSQRITKVSFFP